MNPVHRSFFIVAVVAAICVLVWWFARGYETMQGYTNVQSMSVFVVSLKTRADRRMRVEKHLNDLGIKFRFVDAVIGKELDRNVLVQSGILRSTATMGLGAVGCFLSHIKIWEMMQKEEIPYALVFEDDVVLDPDFVNRANKHMINLVRSKPSFDVLVLGFNKKSEPRGTGAFVDDNVYKPDDCMKSYGTHAYIVSAQGARKMLEHAKPLEKPVDCYMMEYACANKWDLYAVKRYLATEADPKDSAT